MPQGPGHGQERRYRDGRSGGRLPDYPLVASTPEDSFNYAWISLILERVLEEVEAKCHQDGMSAHWYLFHDRGLEPILSRTDPPSLAEICARHGIAQASMGSNMIATVKRRFRDALCRHLRNSTVSEDGAQEEWLELQRLFPEVAQDSK